MAGDDVSLLRAFQPWMLSNFAVGAGYSAFACLLIPPFVTEVTGNPAEAGVVMAIMGLAAVIGPVIGGFADRYRAHRLVLSTGVFGVALGLAMFGVSTENGALQALDALILGVSVAAVGTVGPVFVVSAGYGQAQTASRLTAYNLSAPVGQILGGVLLAAVATWSYPGRFYLAGAFMAVAGMVVLLTSRDPADRIQTEPAPGSAGAEGEQGVGLRAALASRFGLLLLVLTLSSIASNGINSQVANILPNVYGLDARTTSALIALAGLLNLVFLVVAGRMLRTNDPWVLLLIGNAMRFGGALFLAVLGLGAAAAALLVGAAVQLLYQGMPFVRQAQPVIAVGLSPLPSGATNGWVLGSSALGTFAGSLLAGHLAGAFGFNAVNWMGAVAVGAAIPLMLGLRTRRDRRAPAAGPPAG